MISRKRKLAVLSVLLCACLLTMDLSPAADAMGETVAVSAERAATPADLEEAETSSDVPEETETDEEETKASEKRTEASSAELGEMLIDDIHGETSEISEEEAETGENSMEETASAKMMPMKAPAGRTVKITKDGLVFQVDSSDNTATLWDIKNTVTGTLVIPSEIQDDDGNVYPVTKIALWRTSGFKNITGVEIPDSVTAIVTRFRFKNLTELTIPGTVKTFTAELQNMSNLETITFEEGVETIGANTMFGGCEKLRKVNLPSSLKSFASYAVFTGCSLLTSIEIPDGVTCEDMGSMFKNCASLTEISLPASLGNEISNNEFQGCTSLKSVTIRDGKQPEKIEQSAFSGCTSLETIPELDAVTSLGIGAFKGTTALTKPVSLDSLKEIPKYAFQDSGITGVTFSGNLTSIGLNAFYQSAIGPDLEIPDSVTELGDHCFDGCSNLKNITIGNQLNKFGQYSFANCGGLENLTIGRNIVEIDDDDFEGCFDPYDEETDLVTIETAPDEVTVSKIGGYPLDKIVYTEDPSGDADDTISAGGVPLQEAVNTAEDSAEITLAKNVGLSQTLTIPAGKNVTISSSVDGSFLIRGADNFQGDSLIHVEEGASLTLRDVTVRGRNISLPEYRGLIWDEGTFTLADGARVTDGEIRNSNTGVVYATGNAIFNLDGGSILGTMKIGGDTWYCGTVVLRDLSTMEFSDGEISGNYVRNDGTSVDTNSPGILVKDHAALTMAGGVISGNTGCRGSAVSVDGNWRNDAPAFTMTGGTIRGNKMLRTPAYSSISEDVRDSYIPGGAVFGGTGAKISIEGGTISDNVSKGVGGAITVSYSASSFTMEDGTVTGNKAGTGGGIYVYNSNSLISGGRIEGNSASGLGGGVYVEGNTDTYPKAVEFKNTVVTGNSASSSGGGMYFCNTGSTQILPQEGAAIYDNEACTAGADFLVVNKVPEAQHASTISERALGGGAVLWYRDGGVAGNDGYGSFSSTNRFDASDPGDPMEVKDSTDGYALKAVLTDDAKKIAMRSCSLLIAGNTAWLGGGVGANGAANFGESGNKKITLSKSWENVPDDVTLPDSVTIHIYSTVGGETDELDTVKLTKEKPAGTTTWTWTGAWSAEITGLPDEIGEISAKEDVPEGYVGKISTTVGSDGNVTITAGNTWSTEPPTEPSSEPETTAPETEPETTVPETEPETETTEPVTEESTTVPETTGTHSSHDDDDDDGGHNGGHSSTVNPRPDKPAETESTSLESSAAVVTQAPDRPGQPAEETTVVKRNTPATGDESHTGAYLLAIAVSAGLLAAMTILRRRKCD